MPTLKEAIRTYLQAKGSIDWLVVHDLSRANIETSGLKFTLVDNVEREDYPFRTNQGYLCLEGSASLAEAETLIAELLEEFKGNATAIGNLLILNSRLDVPDANVVGQRIIDSLSEDTRKQVFQILMASLNSEYYGHNKFSQEHPANTEEWLNLLRSTEHLDNLYDPLFVAVQLIASEGLFEFVALREMSPFIRCVLVGCYGFDFTISVEEELVICNNEEELAFLAAILLSHSSDRSKIPIWFNEGLIHASIDKYWANVGHSLFYHAFGLSFRNRRANEVYKGLEDGVHAILHKKLFSETTEGVAFIRSCKFPNDFIALFSWFSRKEIKIDDLSSGIREAILNQFISELEAISKSLPTYISTEGTGDPFNSFQLYEPKYQAALAYVLLFFLVTEEQPLSRFKGVCLKFKPLFYGGFRARHLAVCFTEVILIMCLSGNWLTGLDDSHTSKLQRILQIISDTILVPYIHLAEREEEVWNLDSEKEVFHFDAGSALVRTGLEKVRKHEVYLHYKSFYKEIDSIRTTPWSYGTA